MRFAATGFVIAIFAVAGVCRAQQAADNAGYKCPANMKQVAHVCVTDDQQHAQCLWPDAAGGKPKNGNLQDANPMMCPRHPPNQRR